MAKPFDHTKYLISTKKSLLDCKKIWELLKDCFWSKNIPVEYIERFIKLSLCFGVYYIPSTTLVGFGRVISDYTTYAYICDIVVDPTHRKKGIGTTLIQTMQNHPKLQGLKTWSLKATDDSYNIYKKNSFKETQTNVIQLEINDLEIYSDPNFINLYR